MKKKLLGIFVSMLLIGTMAIPISALNKEHLFFGVGIQSAIAEESIISEVESRMLKEIKVSIESNPELKERIEQLKDSDCDCEKDNVNGWDFPVLCTILFILFVIALFTTGPLTLWGLLATVMDCSWAG